MKFQLKEKGRGNAGLDTRSKQSYYRDNNGREIDLLIIENGVLYPIEIKKSADPGREALKNFSVLSSLSEAVGPGCIICLSSQRYPLDDNNMIIPVGMV